MINRGSKGEQLVDAILGFNDLDYIREYAFKNKEGNYQRMDFYVVYNGKEFCLEYHGQQHYSENIYYNHEATVRLDNIKKEYCQNNGIIYLEIPYTMNSLTKVYDALVSFGFDIAKPDNVQVYKEPILFHGMITATNIQTQERIEGDYSFIIDALDNLYQGNIIKCLHGDMDSTGGFTFTLGDNKLETTRLGKCKHRKIVYKEARRQADVKRTPIVMMDINTGEETEYSSIAECVRETGIKGVSSYLYGEVNRLTLGNKMFRLKEGSYKHSLKHVKDNIQKKFIIATCIKDGSIIEGTVNNVAREIGASAPNLSKVLKGKCKTCKGYTATYK